jgi:hypothetical protein
MLQVKQSGDVVSNVSQLINVTGLVSPSGQSVVTCTFYANANLAADASAVGATVTSFLVTGTGENANPPEQGVLTGQTAPVVGTPVSLTVAGWTQGSVSRSVPANTTFIWFDVEAVNQGAPVDGVFIDRASCVLTLAAPTPALSPMGVALLGLLLLGSAGVAIRRRLAALPTAQGG